MKRHIKICFTVLAAAATVSMTAVKAENYDNVSSGMLLGIYAHACGHGLQVTSTIPGYTAEGRLFEGDILKRATVDGEIIYNLRSLYELESAKMAIGPDREAAIEFYRPGEGMLYAWVQFTPLYGPAAVSTSGVKQYKAQFKLESEKPGARQMFRSSSSAPRRQQRTGVVRPHNPGSVPATGTDRSNGAAKLFGKR
ncbi:MAG: hypothetical protein R3C17_02500 [Planctomycetaceae bacterium]